MAVKFILMMALMMVGSGHPGPDPDIHIDVKQVVDAGCGGCCDCKEPTTATTEETTTPTPEYPTTTTTVEPIITTTDQPCILDIIEAGGKGFIFYTVYKTYYEAVQFCETNNMTLATPDENFEEFNHLMPAGEEFWVDSLPDLDDPNDPLIWYWQTYPRKLVTKDQWKDGHWDTSTHGDGKYCSSILKDDHLLDFSCMRDSYFACEYELYQTISVPCPKEKSGTKKKVMLQEPRPL